MSPNKTGQPEDVIIDPKGVSGHSSH